MESKVCKRASRKRIRVRKVSNVQLSQIEIPSNIKGEQVILGFKISRHVQTSTSTSSYINKESNYSNFHKKYRSVALPKQ